MTLSAAPDAAFELKQIASPRCDAKERQGLGARHRRRAKAPQSGEAPTVTPLWKTRMCTFFPNGMCKHGSRCSFAHGEKDMRPSPDFERTSVCPIFLGRGECTRPGCRYAHKSDELRTQQGLLKTKMCSFFLGGHCVVGKACRFAHDPSELQEGLAVQRDRDCTSPHTWEQRRLAFEAGSPLVAGESDAANDASGTARGLARACADGGSQRNEAAEVAASVVASEEPTVAPQWISPAEIPESSDESLEKGLMILQRASMVMQSQPRAGSNVGSDANADAAVQQVSRNVFLLQALCRSKEETPVDTEKVKAADSDEVWCAGTAVVTQDQQRQEDVASPKDTAASLSGYSAATTGTASTTGAGAIRLEEVRTRRTTVSLEPLCPERASAARLHRVVVSSDMDLDLEIELEPSPLGPMYLSRSNAGVVICSTEAKTNAGVGVTDAAVDCTVSHGKARAKDAPVRLLDIEDSGLIEELCSTCVNRTAAGQDEQQLSRRRQRPRGNSRISSVSPSAPRQASATAPVECRAAAAVGNCAVAKAVVAAKAQISVPPAAASAAVVIAAATAAVGEASRRNAAVPPSATRGSGTASRLGCGGSGGGHAASMARFCLAASAGVCSESAGPEACGRYSQCALCPRGASAVAAARSCAACDSGIKVVARNTFLDITDGGGSDEDALAGFSAGDGSWKRSKSR
eukprot:TRINITY_DN38335_c0_g2_i1.p1 TRINITY_DN38335_c0_g2~~TRINITY_DN38335_c0_g2_i1.p1  ORF type:complete len:690 (+),score=130.72 TRINITY_DN38335_c0_g2_i1:71-2140(+)